MQHKYKFINQLTHHEGMIGRTDMEIENEPILYQASYEHAMQYGGPLTKEFLSKLPETKNCIVDTRVHMLMQSWYPAIPGFHLDHIPRTMPFAQPNLARINNQIHYMTTVGDSSIPEFVVQPIELTINYSDKDKTVYGQCNQQLELLQPKLFRVTPNNIWKFTSQDFHRCTMAEKSGWRYFARASYNTGVVPKNKVRRQCQVYLDLKRGW